MEAITLRRCFFHEEREAAARCPSCRQFYCRECITEHEDRAICAACLQRVAGGEVKRRSGSFAGVRRLLAAGLGLVAAWFFFYLVGQGLLAIPSSFHEGDFFEESGP